MKQVMVPYVVSTVGTYVYYHMQAPPDMGNGDAPTHMMKGIDGTIHTDRFGDHLTAYDVNNGEHIARIVGSDGEDVKFASCQAAVKYAVELMRRYPQYYINVQAEI